MDNKQSRQRGAMSAADLRSARAVIVAPKVVGSRNSEAGRRVASKRKLVSVALSEKQAETTNR